MVVEVVRRNLISRMQARKTEPAERELLLGSLRRLSEHDAVIEAMRSMTAVRDILK
jgi:hypothetical protein